nr:nadh-ubiquinone oxidoreductase 29.9 kda subunit, mitochondrial [Quercus suber]
MRVTTRLFAAVRSSQFLEPGAPTGLTGLLTHASPRSTLLYLYNSTLERLQQFPESSVYRQSTEALTKHRMRIIEETRPSGLSEWQARVKDTLEKYPKAFMTIPSIANPGEFNVVFKQAVQSNPDVTTDADFVDKYPFEFGQDTDHEMLEGPKFPDQVEAEGRKAGRMVNAIYQQENTPSIEPEPPLTADQINDIEAKIGAGLIEEVIQVAEGERDLADKLAQSKVWEDLEEKPAPGQWKYAERDTHTPETQAP